MEKLTPAELYRTALSFYKDDVAKGSPYALSELFGRSIALSGAIVSHPEKLGKTQERLVTNIFQHRLQLESELKAQNINLPHWYLAQICDLICMVGSFPIDDLPDSSLAKSVEILLKRVLEEQRLKQQILLDASLEHNSVSLNGFDHILRNYLRFLRRESEVNPLTAEKPALVAEFGMDNAQTILALR